MDSISFICEEKKYITFQEALICINDPELHPLLQSAYLDFVISAYVDLNVEESGTDIDNIWHSYVSCVMMTYMMIVGMTYMIVVRVTCDCCVGDICDYCEGDICDYCEGDMCDYCEGDM